MTCREKFYISHSNMEPEIATKIFKRSCPNYFGYAEKPDYCTGNRCEECFDKCWGREISEEDNRVLSAKTAKLQAQMAADEAIRATTIKDSGDRTEFATGAVRDMREGKGRCDLMPLEVVGNIMGDPIILNLKVFLNTADSTYLYTCLNQFSRFYDDGMTKASAEKIFEQRYCSMFLEVAKHFEEGAKKYGENNWQKGIPVHCYIDSAVRHYLKWLRGDKDEPHDRAFVWNLMCCIWEVDYRPKEEKDEAV